MIETKKVKVIVRRSQLAMGKIKIRVAGDSLVEQFSSPGQFLVDLSIKRNTSDEILAADVKAVGENVFCRALVDSGLLFRGNCGLQLRSNSLHDIILRS